MGKFRVSGKEYLGYSKSGQHDPDALYMEDLRSCFKHLSHIPYMEHLGLFMDNISFTYCSQQKTNQSYTRTAYCLTNDYALYNKYIYICVKVILFNHFVKTLPFPSTNSANWEDLFLPTSCCAFSLASARIRAICKS